MRRFIEQKWTRLFVGVALLSFLQVGWWTYVFMQEVSSAKALKIENAKLSKKMLPSLEMDLTKIHREAQSRKNMFLSESIFFMLLVGIGFYLLYRNFKREERSREAQKNFIEIVSHESKTPLTALKLRLESLLESVNSPTIEEEVRLSLSEIRRLSTIFDKALNLTRLDSAAFHYQDVELSDLVKEVLARLDPLIKSRNVTLSLTSDPEAIVNGDAYAIQNSIQNLVENSILYNDSKERQLEVAIRKSGSKIHVSVKDNGPGIGSCDQAHVFDRFYRGQSAKQIPGTGLGLFIAKYVVEAHRGVIRLLPMPVGGTHIRLEFPAVAV